MILFSFSLDFDLDLNFLSLLTSIFSTFGFIKGDFTRFNFMVGCTSGFGLFFCFEFFFVKY